MTRIDGTKTLGDAYERALLTEAGALLLHDPIRGRDVPMDVRRYLAAPDSLDAALTRDLPGPVLDVGCGPGRMLRAALDCGHAALGVDISSAAVTIARSRGLPALHRSVFDELPDEGAWGSALLLDGNIGIGGDPVQLLMRCARLLRSSGRLLVETHRAARRDHRFHGTLRDPDGTPGPPFPWAEVGRLALRPHAAAAGLDLVREWRSGPRRFAEYERRSRLTPIAAVLAG